MIKDKGEFILATLALTISAVIVSAVVGACIFGIVAGHNGYKTHRFHKQACKELVAQERFDEYVRVCRYIDIIELNVEGTDEPLQIAIPAK